MNWPKVTVVTPSYNQAEYLEAAICSVLDQNYPNLEYFVYDGGSTDGSVEIIKKYADRIDYWVSEPDGGQAAAINRGFTRATGDIVAWLNSDDLYRPNAIRNAVRVLQANPEAPVAHGNVDWIDQHGQPIGTSVNNVVRHPTINDLLTIGCVIQQPSAFIQSWAVQTAGLLDASLYYCLDYEWWFRLRQLGEFAFIDDGSLAAVNFQPNAKTFDIPLKLVQEMYSVSQRHGGNGLEMGVSSLTLRWQGLQTRSLEEQVALFSAEMRDPDYLTLPDDLVKAMQPKLANIWAELAFTLATQRQDKQAASAMRRAVLHKPRFLTNRGVLAILWRSLRPRPAVGL